MSTTKPALIGLLFAVLMAATRAAAASAAADAAAPLSNQSQQYLEDVCRNTRFTQRCIDSLSRASNISDPRSLFNALLQEARKECARAKMRMIPAATRKKNPPLPAAYACCSEYVDYAVSPLNQAVKYLSYLGAPGTSFSDVMRDLSESMGNFQIGVVTCYMPTDCISESASEDTTEELSIAVRGIEEFAVIGWKLAEKLPDLLKNSGIDLGTIDPPPPPKTDWTWFP